MCDLPVKSLSLEIHVYQFVKDLGYREIKTFWEIQMSNSPVQIDIIRNYSNVSHSTQAGWAKCQDEPPGPE